MLARRTALALAAAGLLVPAGCGKKEITVRTPEPAAERGDAPADPPRGWRTHVSPRAGFTIALPRSWSAREREEATRIRSRDGAVVVSLQADRSEAGRTTPAREYALATLRALPGYRDLAARGVDAPDSPYEAACAAGSGTREHGNRRQRVSVTVLRRPGEVAYTAVAFSDPRARSGRRTLDRALATLRARPPAP